MNITEIRRWPPGAIEAESFRIIDEELGMDSGGFLLPYVSGTVDPGGETFMFNKLSPEFSVMVRAIHASGDLQLAECVRFHPEAVSTGIAAIRAGRDVLVDVGMVAAGIDATRLARWGGRVRCLLGDEGVAEQAGREGRTRTATAIARGIMAAPGIVAVGNAPTALLRTIEILAATDPPPVGLVIGVPVGFVNAAESKALLADKTYPFITLLGRKGGSPVAAAMVNALLRLAEKI